MQCACIASLLLLAGASAAAAGDDVQPEGAWPQLQTVPDGQQPARHLLQDPGCPGPNCPGGPGRPGPPQNPGAGGGAGPGAGAGAGSPAAGAAPVMTPTLATPTAQTTLAAPASTAPASTASASPAAGAAVGTGTAASPALSPDGILQGLKPLDKDYWSISFKFPLCCSVQLALYLSGGVLGVQGP